MRFASSLTWAASLERRPFFFRHCVPCRSGKKVQPELRTRKRAALLLGAACALRCGAAAGARTVAGLRVLAARFGDAAQRTAGVARAIGEGDVAERHDSHQPL